MPSSATIETLVIAYGLLGDDHVQAIREAAPGAEVHVLSGPNPWKSAPEELAARAQVILGALPSVDPAAVPRLSWIHQPGAGADWLMRAPAFRDSDILLTNSSGVHAIPIAEHILALMLTLSRRIHRFVKAQRDHEWLRRGRLGELDGATLGVVGLGAIGEKTAHKAKGLNMHVLGLRRRPERASPFVDEMFGLEDLHEMLGRSDWVALTCPLTPETRGLIDAPALAAMKQTAYLINIARGAVVDEAALIRALEEGQIGGAGLDVFETEPLPPESPLWDMRNVVITPHFAGATPYYADRVIEIFVDNLQRYQRGKPLRNLVDKRLWY